MTKEIRPVCVCGNPMWKKQVLFPDNPVKRRQIWICGKDGRTKSLPIYKELDKTFT